MVECGSSPLDRRALNTRLLPSGAHATSLMSPKGFDGRGNYTLGLKDQLIFLEIDYLKVDKGRGMNVSVVTTAKTDEEARKLLQLMGMPFRTAGN